MRFLSRRTRRHDRVRSARRTSSLGLEQLESRVVLSTFTVTNTVDSGTGSLRQAILDANANVGGDIIQFASGVTGTITLTSGELDITDAVDLQGPGSGVVTVSGNNASRVFSVSANATISGLTISGGKSDHGGGIYNNATLSVSNTTVSGNAAAFDGGGIYNSYGTLTVDSSILSGNTAGGLPATTGAGGGIINLGTLTVSNTTLSGNSASYEGGAILNDGLLTVQTSTYSGNSGWLYGGGIRNYGMLSVDSSTFSSNSAGFGGGINNASGTATVDSSTFSGNSASNSGGGIANNATLTVDSSTFIGNSTAVYGGGMFVSGGTATVDNSTFTGNSAAYGGGINNFGGCTLTVDSSTLSGNTDSGYGGGLYTRGTSTLNNTIVAANLDVYGKPSNDIDGTLAGGSSHNLIGVGTSLSGIGNGTNGNQVGTAAAPINPMLGFLQDHGGPTLTMALLPGSPAIDAGDNSLIPAGVTTDQRGTGYARIAGGTVDIGAFELAVVNHPPVTFLVTNLADNGPGSLRQAILDANANPGSDIIRFASGVTGTITLTSGELDITDDAINLQGPGSGVVTVSGNNASRVFRVTANATISGLTITGGKSDYGGGISNAYGTLTLQNTTITGNSAITGGGIYNAFGALSVDSSILSGDSASSLGGGIYSANYGTFTVVQNCTFSGNSAGSVGSNGFGAGISNLGTLTVSNTTLSGNSATYDGGGIYNTGRLTVSNSTLNGNSAGGLAGSNGFGGGISNYGTLTVQNSTISGNTTSYDGGGISNDGTAIVLISTIANNSGWINGGGIFNNAMLSVDNSTFSGNTAAFGGGIDNYSTLTVHSSTFSGNSANTGGGGIANNATLTVDSSTFIGNSANAYGGGMFDSSGTAILENSTLSGNSARQGGGIYNNGGCTLTVDSSTLSGNTDSGYGGGLYTPGTSTLNNTIVAANLDVYGHPSNDIDGTLAGGSSHNLVGVGTSLSGISNGTNGNQVGTAAAPINPMLGLLQDHGGPTLTMALLPGSPAIDAGDNSQIPAGVTTDQRGTGYARIVNGTVDIGAFEVQIVPTTTALTTSASPSTYGQSVTFTATVSDTGGTVPTGGVEFYDGTTDLGPGSSLSGSGQSATSTFTTSTVAAGVHASLSAIYTPTGSFGGSSGSLSQTVTQANATIVVTPYSVTYDFSAHTAAGTATGVMGESLSGLDLSGTTHTGAGTYNGDAWTFTDVTGNYNNAKGMVNDSISLPKAAAYVLNATALSGAVTASGNATVTLSGGLFVDSSSSSAILASGNAKVNVGSSVLVVGGVSKNGNASVTKTGSPPATNDPLASLTPPSLTGLTNYGAVSVSGNSTKTLNPGIYSSIKISGNASVTLTGGTYIILGGGFTVSGNASVSGSGVTIFNAGSNYNGTTDGGSFGGITLSGNGNFHLSPPTSGTYAGIVIYQSRVNTRALSIGGNALVNVQGAIYAARAKLTLSGNGNLQDSLVVDTLNVSGNVSLTQMAAGSDGAGDAPGIANSLLAGDLSLFINDPGGLFTPDQRARIQDAIHTWNVLLAPYNVTITQVSDPTLANMVIDIGLTSACGGSANGVLGCFNAPQSEITMIQDWNWYAGSDPTQIAAGQYDFETTVLHELGHALGLGGATKPSSPMSETLAAGVADRTVTTQDLNIPDPPAGADPQTAVPYHPLMAPGALSQNEFSAFSAVTTLDTVGQAPSQSAHLKFTQASPALTLRNASAFDHGSTRKSGALVSVVQSPWSTAPGQIRDQTGWNPSAVLPEASRASNGGLTPVRIGAALAAADQALDELGSETVLERGTNESETAGVLSLPLPGVMDSSATTGFMHVADSSSASGESKPWLTDLLFAAGLAGFCTGMRAVRMRRTSSVFDKKGLLKLQP